MEMEGLAPSCTYISRWSLVAYIQQPQHTCRQGLAGAHLKGITYFSELRGVHIDALQWPNILGEQLIRCRIETLLDVAARVGFALWPPITCAFPES